MPKSKKPAKRMAEGGPAEKESVYRAGMADPRSGVERISGLINRVASGNRKAPVRRYDDSPTTMAKNRRASRKR